MFLFFELGMGIIFEGILELFFELLGFGFVEESHFLFLFVEFAIVDLLLFVLNIGNIEDRSQVLTFHTE